MAQLHDAGRSCRRKKLEAVLRYLFQLPASHNYQYSAIDKLLGGEGVLVVAGTGTGKSVIPQFTALALGRVAFIITPFTAIVDDQCRQLAALGLPAMAALAVPRLLTFGVVYSAPEGLAAGCAGRRVLQDLVARRVLGCVAVDEVHEVVQTGAGYRDAMSLVAPVVREHCVLAIQGATPRCGLGRSWAQTPLRQDSDSLQIDPWWSSTVVAHDIGTRERAIHHW